MIFGKGQNMKKVLYMHTGSGNHGCEAIIRTTAKLLDGPKDVQLWSFLKKEEYQYGTADAVEKVFRSEELPRFSLPHIEAFVRRKLFRQTDANMDIFIREVFKDNIALSVGGDNYCYPWSASQAVELDKKIRKYCKKSVFWGCSIEESAITPQVREDLEKFDLITARETLSYEILKQINPNTVLVADPAFLLEKTELPLPQGFLAGNTVGINVSPLVMDYGDSDIIMGNYVALMDYILTHTDMNICLIPHVVWENNNDRKPIAALRERFRDAERVCCLEDHNCMELKGYIARCRYFIGARTHATIAAYSTGVPTLVVGYSVKSRGIAQDLFGTDKNFVLPVQELQNQGELVAAFRWLEQKENNIREKLAAVMPEYQEKARSAKTAFEALL